jgi:predicted transcriptional regulator
MANKTKSVDEKEEAMVKAVGVALTPSQFKKLDALCAKLERGRSWIIRQALLNYPPYQETL